MAGTTYVILTKVGEGETVWREIGSQDGANDLSAIKQFLEKSDGEYGAGFYRAVPKRSWPTDPHELKPQVRFV